MWTLGKRNGENALNVVVKEYDGQVLIHLRHYFKLLGKIVGIQRKKGSHWIWQSRIHSTSLLLTLIAKWDVSVVWMNKLNHLLQKELKEICSQLLVGKMNECMKSIAKSCTVNVICMFLIRFTFIHIYISIFNDEGTILDQYADGVGLVAFKWFKVWSELQTFHLGSCWRMVRQRCYPYSRQMDLPVIEFMWW